MEIRTFGVAQDSIVDGPGLRYSVFVQGCKHACPGCHNPESHDPNGGEVHNVDEIVADIKANPLIHDVTISGGEPFDQPEACAELAHELKSAEYGVWAYTGYLFEDLLKRNDPATNDFLSNIDVLVDGPFVESKRSLELTWKGSSNQRVIDVPASLCAGSVVLSAEGFPEDNFVSDDMLKKPSSW